MLKMDEMKWSWLTKRPQALIAAVSALLFLPFLGRVHLFDWDEINFAECAREMLATGKYLYLQMNFQPFWEKPPLFIWLSALSMKLFGINEFAARFPNAVCGILTLILVYRIGNKLHNRMHGLAWAACFGASTLPHFYFKSGIIDPWFNLFIFLAIYVYFLYVESRRESKPKPLKIVVASLLTALAVLTKGPAALVVVFGCIGFYHLVKRFKSFPATSVIAFTLLTVVFSGLWFVLILANDQGEIITNFISYQVHLFRTGDAGHEGPVYYHALVLLFGCFPASVLALPAFRSSPSSEPAQNDFRRWMLILFWVVLVLFSIVKTKIVHYSSLCYFPLTYLASLTACRLIENKMQWKRAMVAVTLLTGGAVAVLLGLLPFAAMNIVRVIDSGIINDYFTMENLGANVEWTGAESLIGFFALTMVIVSSRLFVKGKHLAGVTMLLGGNLFLVSAALFVIVPKVEGYTQRSAVEFYKSLQGKDCYVLALNYHSYAQHFYPLKQPGANPESFSPGWLLRGPIDKDAYFVCKQNSADDSLAEPGVISMGRKNGYAFYMRKAAGTQ
jgi:hypothetical protein